MSSCDLQEMLDIKCAL